jgi:hypothetical protein
MCVPVYFALDQPPSIYDLSSQLQNAVEKSKTELSDAWSISEDWIWNEISNRRIFPCHLLQIGIVVTQIESVNAM